MKKEKESKISLGKSFKTKQSFGFTLIELLIVIAIIGLLSSVVLASLNSARAKARDARRLADFKQWQLALELYYDANNQYPSPPPCHSGNWALNHPHPPYMACWNALASNLAPYLSKLPLDPLDTYPPTPSYNPYHYMPRNANQGYYILMDPETIDANKDDGCYPDIWYCKGVNWQ